MTKLVDFLIRAQDIDVHTISPYRLADHWQMPRKQVLNVFFEATKVGMLNFNWDLYCPSCRSLQERCKTLHEIHETIFCEVMPGTCSSQYFSSNIHLSFSPNSLVRKLSDKAHCFSGPQNWHHIPLRQYLEPGQKSFLKLSLPHGTYHMRFPGTEGEIQVTVIDRGEKEIGISICNRGFNREPVQISSKAKLLLHNKSNRKQLVILENCSWGSQLLTAANVTSRQQFRDLFEGEIFPKAEKIAVANQTLMFTDLIGSTGMYNKEGDQKAVERVIDHFDVLQQAVSEENGAIVKTIGDSVMAVFANPTDAYMAYKRAQQVISSDKQYNNSLKLKAGIHHGSCVAVNLNNRIDYLGSTVNIASRLADFADGDEVVLSRSACKAIDNDVLQLNDHPSKEIKIRLRGFDDEEFRVKQVALKEPTLKLVV
ncbi:MAG: adenylate/guanylate cyclase domain-containing protein [Balneolaceae bacterium]|nr:adenylate/guanylate cyclase domain-containing protein [Balneolaceae bacterium]